MVGVLSYKTGERGKILCSARSVLPWQIFEPGNDGRAKEEAAEGCAELQNLGCRIFKLKFRVILFFAVVGGEGLEASGGNSASPWIFSFFCPFSPTN